MVNRLFFLLFYVSSSQSLRAAKSKVFTQHSRASRIPSLWCTMNILPQHYVISAWGGRFESTPFTLPPDWPMLQPCDVLIGSIFLLLHKQEQSALVLGIISSGLVVTTHCV